ncbi:glycogen debranching protein GlgX [Gordonia sp. PP30]|uniref:glycogen debranching protein GlgX n=1 Tax=Gordonia sp. PP30 TaxID=2935861 RepID=UPI001FFE882F|nr:glycogen debranching protein GlgX [Gordonia sp. PP30]UQE75460.1 glycogen debranching protein GlgX [Gordonia sp. PP30]
MTRPSPRVSAGRPWPLGVTVDGDGVNVAVSSETAERIDFCLFAADGTEDAVPLPFRDGNIHHAHVRGVGAGARYGLRAHGPQRPADGLRFNPAKLLIDPYARALDGPIHWHPLMSGFSGDDDLSIDSRDSAPAVPKGVVVGHTDGEPGPNPAANRPGHAAADLVIYEAHVKGISAAHPEVPPEVRGTYEGMAHPAVLDHLTALGVNAVELLPVQAFFDDRRLVEMGLTNYWGYQPIGWFAPEPRYARADAVAEFRGLVHALHERGIAVICDVVYNHSGEGDEFGPTISLRGLDNRFYYRLHDGGRHYNDDTGTGNTLAVDRLPMLRLVLDSLRYWVTEFGVDGFRFDLGTTLGRGRSGFRRDGRFFTALRQDPVLAGVILIAEPWDIGPGGYQLGHFPPPLHEWNDEFRDGVRRIWRGEETLGEAGVGALLLGCAHRFDHAGRPASTSVNFLTAHDGFTLADLVSYAVKHNEANLEDGRDGHNDNHSDNLGVEGPTDDPAITRARARRMRGMLATLLVSQGIPMLLAGDEIGNGQGGNNNAYAQDNPIGWLDWSAPDTELFEVVRRLIALRRELPVLRQRTFLHGRERADGQRDAVWSLPDGREPAPDDWHSVDRYSIALTLRGAAGDPVGELLPDAVCVIVNVGPDIDFALPRSNGPGWRSELDTARPDGPAAVGAHYPVAEQSVVVLRSADGPPTAD